MSASIDTFLIKITGKGGHGAMPHDTVDAVVCGAEIVSALQHIVSRTVDPSDSAVISVCQFYAGTDSPNVIPATAELGGTVRALKSETRKRLEERLRQVVKSVAEAFGTQVEVKWEVGPPPVVNTAKETQFAREVATEVVGQDKVLPLTPTMGSEDFAYFLEACPGAYIILGQGKTNEDPGLHNSRYDFNDEVLPVGAAYWVRLAETWLKAN